MYVCMYVCIYIYIYIYIYITRSGVGPYSSGPPCFRLDGAAGVGGAGVVVVVVVVVVVGVDGAAGVGGTCASRVRQPWRAAVESFQAA